MKFDESLIIFGKTIWILMKFRDILYKKFWWILINFGERIKFILIIKKASLENISKINKYAKILI
jgi:GT2 family glycosyltransferase